MDDTLLQELHTAKDAAEKAAIVAEFILQDLPPEIALVARRCVLLHWFDESIITALTQGTTLSADDMEIVYEHIASLPFIETVSWGLTFQDLTREGLLRRYTYSQQELLKTAARLAAPAYEAQNDEKIVAEAFFCHTIAGNHQASTILLNTLLTQASSRNDWQHIDNLLHLQEEAEAFPFVQPLPRTEQQWLVRGLVHSIQGKRDEAVLDYEKALTFNSKNALTYLSRGTTYAQQKRYEQALSDYKKSLRLDPTLSQAYLNRGIIYTKQQNYKQALKDFNLALQRDPGNTFILQNQGNTLNELGHFEEALATYQKALNIDAYVAETYIGKGKTHIELGQYANALAAYERAIQLDANAVDAYIGKGQTLLALERYKEALATYEEAIRLNPRSADAYMGKGKALSRLQRYEEANIAFNQAQQLDPHTADVDEEQEHLDANNDGYSTGNLRAKAKTRLFGSRRSTTWSDTLRRPSRFLQKPARRNQSLVWYRLNRGLALLPVIAIIIFSLLIFRSLSTLTGTLSPHASSTATAAARATDIAVITHATATANAQATASVIAANPNPYAPKTGKLALLDSLNGSSSDASWNTKPGCSFSNEAYHTSEAANATFFSCFLAQPTFSNFVLQVDMKIIHGDCGGISFRANSSTGQQYIFRICQDNDHYYLYRCTSYNTNCTLLKSDLTSDINSGLGAANTIAIVTNGTTIDLYINDTKVNSATDTAYSSGQIGLIASTINNHTEVVYTNLKLWVL